jgi:hypothetical protein
MPIGDTFIEVVAPVEEGTTAGRLLDKRGGDGGYMAIFQVDDIAAARANAERLGVRVVARFDGDPPRGGLGIGRNVSQSLLRYWTTTAATVRAPLCLGLPSTARTGSRLTARPRRERPARAVSASVTAARRHKPVALRAAPVRTPAEALL